MQVNDLIIESINQTSEKIFKTHNINNYYYYLDRLIIAYNDCILPTKLTEKEMDLILFRINLMYDEVFNEVTENGYKIILLYIENYIMNIKSKLIEYEYYIEILNLDNLCKELKK